MATLTHAHRVEERGEANVECRRRRLRRDRRADHVVEATADGARLLVMPKLVEKMRAIERAENRRGCRRGGGNMRRQRRRRGKRGKRRVVADDRRR